MSSVDINSYNKLLAEKEFYRKKLQALREVLAISQAEFAVSNGAAPPAPAPAPAPVQVLVPHSPVTPLMAGKINSAALLTMAAPIAPVPLPVNGHNGTAASSIPKFSGNVFPRDGSDLYWSHAYQYASSSESTTDRPGLSMQPKFIVYVKNEDDIKLAIKYANDNNVHIAVRSGGHQYSGASSTSGENIQIDMTEMENTGMELDEATQSVRVSVGCSLRVFNSWLGSKQMFLPHGQCSNVHIGGHGQTGGVGQLLRSHGLFGDHIDKIEVFDATGTKRIVGRDSVNKADKDLYWAILGGSPGNFGVITHYHFKPLLDSSFLDSQGQTKSRGLRSMYFYSKATMKALLDVMVEWNNDPNFPADYDYCVTMLSASIPGFVHLKNNLDQNMREKYREIYGKDDIWGWPPVIVVYLQYAGLPGGNFDQKYFNRISDAAKSSGAILITSTLDGSTTTPMSELTKDWIFENVREFVYPFEKRCYLTNATTELVKNNWTEWISERIDFIERDFSNGCSLSIQIQPFGGKNSVYANNKNNGTSYSWRDTTICAVMDCFYDDNSLFHPHAGDTARAWQKLNDFESKEHFSSQDRRTLWGSYGAHNLDSVHQFYYDDEAKYSRLCAIKEHEDPNGIFTPNEFCVGKKAAASAPAAVNHPHAALMAFAAPLTARALTHKFDDKVLSATLEQRVAQREQKILVHNDGM